MTGMEVLRDYAILIYTILGNDIQILHILQDMRMLSFVIFCRIIIIIVFR